MGKRWNWFLIGVSLAGCAGGSGDGDSPPDAAAAAPHTDAATDSDAGAQQGLILAAACTDSMEDVYATPRDLPSYDATHRGDVVRCAVDQSLSVDELEQALQAQEFADIDVRSSVRTYRIAYRTDRLLGQEGLSTALLVLPDQPIAEHPPLVVGGHGFNGLADACRFSTQFALTEDAPRSGSRAMGMMLALAGYGYPVIAPDYAGWDTSSTTLLVSQDEAHSLLDSTRAVRNLLQPGGTSEQVVLVGHSQGGHAVLSAQARAASYGLAGQLVAVVPFATPWYPARIWGAVISTAAGFTTTDNASAIGVAMSYFYSHAELYDGPGSGLLLYQSSKRDLVAGFASAACTPEAAQERLMALGDTTSDFLEPAFLDSVGTCGLTGDPNCASEPAATWIERFRDDRPALDPEGAEILLWQAGEDPGFTPDLGMCAVDKINDDLSAPGATAGFTVCGDRIADHETILSRNMTWTARWIASRTLGAPEPAACPGLDALQPDDGGTLACPGVPGNTD